MLRLGSERAAQAARFFMFRNLPAATCLLAVAPYLADGGVLV